MDEKLKKSLFDAVSREPLARCLGMKLAGLERGYSKVQMQYEPSRMNNIYQRAHGGAIFSLIDEAFETASQTEGTIAVALNVNVCYMASPENGALLTAEARQINSTRKISNFNITVKDQEDKLIASCQATAYRTDKPVLL